MGSQFEIVVQEVRDEISVGFWYVRVAVVGWFVCVVEGLGAVGIGVRMAEMCRAIFGASAIRVTSRFMGRVFFSARMDATRRKISMLAIPRIDSSVFGKC